MDYFDKWEPKAVASFTGHDYIAKRRIFAEVQAVHTI
jgi:hypothetical protein